MKMYLVIVLIILGIVKTSLAQNQYPYTEFTKLHGYTKIEANQAIKEETSAYGSNTQLARQKIAEVLNDYKKAGFIDKDDYESIDSENMDFFIENSEEVSGDLFVGKALSGVIVDGTFKYLPYKAQDRNGKVHKVLCFKVKNKYLPLLNCYDLAPMILVDEKLGTKEPSISSVDKNRKSIKENDNDDVYNNTSSESGNKTIFIIDGLDYILIDGRYYRYRQSDGIYRTRGFPPALDPSVYYDPYHYSKRPFMYVDLGYHGARYEYRKKNYNHHHNTPARAPKTRTHYGPRR
ncbi:MAG: hypothetical protein WC795_02030 [Candidatus Paceibacterota bacterium]|jgi:hypothetical protein